MARTETFIKLKQEGWKQDLKNGPKSTAKGDVEVAVNDTHTALYIYGPRSGKDARHAVFFTPEEAEAVGRAFLQGRRTEEEARLGKLENLIEQTIRAVGNTIPSLERRYKLIQAGLDGQFPCPRKPQHMVDLEICDARKARKQFGCGNCKIPAQKRREAKRRKKK